MHIQPTVFSDHRGRTSKTFHAEVFRAHGLVDRFDEAFHSTSGARVLRGLHFQRPPQDHVKLVHCTAGAVLDVVVDIRRGSPTEGRYVATELSAEQANMVYIPEGFAHGWYALTETVTVAYQASKVFSPEHDAGVRWDSVGFPWPDKHPVLSAKDMALPTLEALVSPFEA